MQTPEKSLAGMDKDKDKADTKRLARCGKCVNCKSQVRSSALNAAPTESSRNLRRQILQQGRGCWCLPALCLASGGPAGRRNLSEHPVPRNHASPRAFPSGKTC